VDRAQYALVPVVALEQDQEVVATHVAEKVAGRVAHVGEHGGGEFQHFVALPVAVLIVERLEVVQIDVARVKPASLPSRRAMCELIGMLPGRKVSGFA
jgi:hypothetical protein